jgi:outer membrane lipoprotein carrier protein
MNEGGTMRQTINKGMLKFTLFMLLIFSVSRVTLAGAETQKPSLTALLASITTLQANFKQTIRSEKGKVLQNFTGKMALKKPAQFRWEVTSSDPRLIVANGKEVFDYDQELAQVTIQKIKAGHTRAPIFFLTGEAAALEEDFNVESLGTAQTCLTASDTCFLLTPTKKDTPFQTIKLGFKAGTLKEMEMLDQLGQRSQFIFNEVIQNKPLEATRFQFTPPKGVDVLYND